MLLFSAMATLARGMAEASVALMVEMLHSDCACGDEIIVCRTVCRECRGEVYQSGTME